MKRLMIGLSLACCALQGHAITPLWMREARISPDGTEIAFGYKGDIYKVPVQGGTAVQLTTQSSYEYNPVWSPDGSQIAFASDRNGNFDVFVMPSSGGSAKRLTYRSQAEVPCTFTPDGNYILFSACIQDPASSALFPATTMTELYRVPTTGGTTQQVLGTPAERVCYNKEGTKFLYQDRKGSESEWRKHHTSSATRNIWLYDTEDGHHINLTDREGEDRNPIFSPDENSVYFLSERDGGSFNVYSLSLDNPQEVKAITRFKTHPVRFLSMSDDGTLCFTYDGEIYTKAPDEAPQKVKINLLRDDETKVTNFNFTQGASSSCVSPNGKQIAFVIRGNVFVTSADYTTTKQITSTPASEANPDFSPDSHTLAYASERTGNWQLYLARAARKEEQDFPNATIIEEEVLLPSKTVERQYPKFSPDGTELAFIEDRTRLMVVNLETKEVRQITDGSKWFTLTRGFSYNWSPDGKWFTLEFIGNQHDPYADIGIVSAQGGEIVNLTNSGYTCSDPQWVLDGNAILFKTDRFGMRAQASWGSQYDAMLVFMNKGAYDRFQLSKEDAELLREIEEQRKAEGEEETDEEEEETDENAKDKDEETSNDIVVEIDGIEDRTVRLTPNSSDLGSLLLSRDGANLYYTCSFEGGYDLWKMNLLDKEPRRVHKLNASSLSLAADLSDNIFLFSSQSMQRMDPKSETLKKISYQAEMKMNLAEEREAMFNHVYRQEQKCFYTEDMHGVDWDAMTAAYRKFLPHINNNYDYAWLLSEWLGELNVSHTGGRYYPAATGDNTAQLGVLFDWTFEGDGMRVAEIVEKSPFDTNYTKLKPGCIIEKINGENITNENVISILLNNKAKKKTLVSIYNPETDERWDEVVTPITDARWNDLLYERWVKQRAAEVEEWSGGRLGYVHIKAMGDDSFRGVYSDILGKYNNCDGIVIDTRFNGGGRLHEDIETLFSGEKYLTQVVRGREACDMPSRRWNKPSIMLQSEANYSNAHGTPWVYKHKEIGKLVGMPVAGTMTTVSWERLQDSSLVFGIPVIGYRLPDGTYLENTELNPDIQVENSPETVVLGEDTQLRTAVEELLREIDSPEE
ncbi:MAG: S41 family peptidase [Prevotellaceae bacterium]|nr:S41 family peptidase [Prevotellaceae bacterium]